MHVAPPPAADEKADFSLGNGFLATYLDYVEETESPRIFHIWSVLAGIGACMGRRVYLPFGHTKLFANNYVLLVGPPGVRKSTAINLMEKRLRAATAIKFAPSDTGGQRQGLLAAMVGDEEDAETKELREEMARGTEQTFDLERLAKHRIALDTDPRDQHCLLAVASEFNSFIGHNAIDMLTFLIKVWDGEDYEYRLKTAQQTLRDPLLTIVGGTTPTNIATAMPSEAIGQGFMSRMILVFANQKYKRVARPKQLDPDLEKQIENVFHWAFYEMDGPMSETAEAIKWVDSIYDRPVGINDPRFVYYAERRHVHLLKTAMCLAALRRSTVIELADYRAADTLLKITEEFMPEALGEYGLSPLASAKQKLVEFLAHANEPVSATVLWTVMHREMKQLDFTHAMADLCNAGKVKQVNTQYGVGYVYKESKRMDYLEALGSLIEE